MTQTDSSRVAVVLSGGGASGAYQVGVLQALVNGDSPGTDYKPLDPALFSGTSVGAYNAAIMAQQNGSSTLETVRHLEWLWFERIAASPEGCGNGVYRLRLNAAELDPKCFLRHPGEAMGDLITDTAFLGLAALDQAREFVDSHGRPVQRLLASVDLGVFVSPEPFYQLCRETVDVEKLAASTKGLFVTVSLWSPEAAYWFTKRQIVHGVGVRAIIASAALPGIFPPVNIEGKWFVDGSVLVQDPVLPAISQGANHIHVVSAVAGRLPSPVGQSTFDSLINPTLLRWNAGYRHGLRVVESMNQLVDRVPPEVFRAFAQVLMGGRGEADFPVDKIRLHSYFPSMPLGGPLDFLNFSREGISQHMELGYADAVNHDCEKEGCILA